MKFGRTVVFLLGFLSGFALAQEPWGPRAVADSLSAARESTLSAAPVARDPDSLLSDSITLKREEVASKQLAAVSVAAIGGSIAILGTLMKGATSAGCDLANADLGTSGGGDPVQDQKNREAKEAKSRTCKDGSTSTFVMAFGGALLVAGVVMLVSVGRDADQVRRLEQKARTSRITLVPGLDPISHSGRLMARVEF